MKKSIAFIFTASTLFLAGCRTANHTGSLDYAVYRDLSDADLNKLGHQGWRIAGFSKDETQGLSHTTFIMERKSQ